MNVTLKQIQAFLEHGVAGIVLVGDHFAADLLLAIRQHNVPVVTTAKGARPDDDPPTAVAVDDPPNDHAGRHHALRNELRHNTCRVTATQVEVVPDAGGVDDRYANGVVCAHRRTPEPAARSAALADAGSIA